ncbi:MAG: transketolase [Pelolinea sp.]|nr:transketolase [Pelolinea sp.]
MSDENVKNLEYIANEIRRDVIQTAYDCAEGVHVGGSLSLAEMYSVLFFSVAKLDPNNLKWADRDRIILSKGHGNVGFSAAMARRGFFPLEELKNFDKLNAMLSMHVDKHRMPGVEISSGSLGHGLPVSVGIALGGKLDQADWQVYCILGDGEMMEGSNWEALMSGAHYKLDNLTAIVDRNMYCIGGPTEEVMSLEPLADKIRDFGWQLIEVDGNDVEQLLDAFNRNHDTGKPKLILANTIKGKGVSFLEGKASSHFAHFNSEEAARALAELEQNV